MLCGQGPAPAAATIERYRELGLDLVPGTGPAGRLRAGRVRRLDAAAARLRHAATARGAELRDRLRARRLSRCVPGIARTIARRGAVPRRLAGVGRAAGCRAPGPRTRFAQPRAGRDLRADRRRPRRRAATARRRSTPRATPGTEGFVAEAIDRFSADAGDGLLHAADDLAALAAPRSRSRSTLDFRGLDRVQDRAVGPGAGVPAAARAARRLRPGRACRRAELHPHRGRVRQARVRRPRGLLRRRAPTCRWTRCCRARYARRAARAGRRDDGVRRAAARRRTGALPAPASRRRAAVGAGEPTRGDTCHLDVADRFGNLVSATPSGGWLQSSPAIPGLGFCLGTRAQMFWLEDGLPSSLAPGRRPRTTLSPTLALRDGEPVPGVRHARRRPAGPVGAAVLPRPRVVRAATCRRRSTRRRSTPTTSRPRSTRARPRRARWRVEARVGRGRGRRAAPPRPRRDGRRPWSLGRLSAVALDDGVLSGRQPARHAGVRRRPVVALGQREQCRPRRSRFRSRRDLLRDQPGPRIRGGRGPLRQPAQRLLATPPRSGVHAPPGRAVRAVRGASVGSRADQCSARGPRAVGDLRAADFAGTAVRLERLAAELRPARSALSARRHIAARSASGPSTGCRNAGWGRRSCSSFRRHRPRMPPFPTPSACAGSPPCGSCSNETTQLRIRAGRPPSSPAGVSRRAGAAARRGAPRSGVRDRTP